MAEASNTYVPYKDGQTWIGDPPPWQPYVPVPPYPGIQPLTWPPQRTTTTIRLHNAEDTQRIADLEALLALAHDLLLAGDDDESFALCELIEDAGIVP